MPRKRYTCPECGKKFRTPRGLSTHNGIMHRAFAPEMAGRKRLRQDDPPSEEDGFSDGDSVLVEDDREEEEEEEITPEHQPADPAAAEARAAAAREEAKQMLRDPSWVKYAEDLLAYCEEGPLQDVGQLFPGEEQFENRDTYRFKQLYHAFPGATFGHELLKPDPEDRIDLSQVLLCQHYSMSE